MDNNITIEFKPTTTCIDWFFAQPTPCKIPNLEYFSILQIEETINYILEKIPVVILDAMKELGWKIIVTNTRNLENDCKSPTKIYGYTNFDTQTIYVYATKDGIPALLHEIAHFVDLLLNISNTKEWNNVYNIEKSRYETLKNSFTCINNKSECFADAFMLYYLHKERLDINAPKTYGVMEYLDKYIKYAITKECVEKRKDVQNQDMKNLIEKLSNISAFPEHCSYW